MRRTFIWLVTVVLAATALPSVAHALSVRATKPLHGPRLDGSRVVWGEEQRDRSLRVRSADQAGTRTELGMVSALPGRSAFDLAVGGGGVAVARVGWPVSTNPVPPNRYIVGIVGAVPFIDCTAPSSFLTIAAPRIAGDGVTLAGPGAGCRGDAVLVRTPGVPDRTIAEPGPVVDLRVTGDWLAATVSIGGTGWVVVHDLRTQREAYRMALTPPSFGYGSTPLYSFDVDRDGTVAVGEPRLIGLNAGSVVPGPGCELWWASPAEPRRHAVPVAACSNVRLRNGVLLFTRQDGPVTALVATTPAGAAPITIRWAPSIGGVDVFADRLAYSDQSCLGTTVIRTGRLQPAMGRRPTGCVIRVVSRGPLRMDTRGRVPVTVECPNGCDGALHALRCAHQRCVAEPAPVRLAAGRRTVVRLRLTDRARRLVRRGGTTATIKTFASLGPTRAVQRRIVARSVPGAPSGPEQQQ